MNIYVFGNKDHQEDSIALKVLDQIKERFKNINFMVIDDPQSEFEPEEKVPIILDAAVGIEKVVVIENLEKIDLPSTSSLHDFDLAFNLKFMKKIGKIDGVKVIALPMNKSVDEILIPVMDEIRKLVSRK